MQGPNKPRKNCAHRFPARQKKRACAHRAPEAIARLDTTGTKIGRASSSIRGSSQWPGGHRAVGCHWDQALDTSPGTQADQQGGGSLTSLVASAGATILIREGGEDEKTMRRRARRVSSVSALPCSLPDLRGRAGNGEAEPSLGSPHQKERNCAAARRCLVGDTTSGAVDVITSSAPCAASCRGQEGPRRPVRSRSLRQRERRPHTAYTVSVESIETLSR
eukprot:CAMPEP_0176297562 /NCGR_PEP_ID=MMETSP0121_2-20121125/58786_1 /TAXON_ID=160619 /ORGANISM="Kryptoperidinium foliaceum, Strain CCMP 1326" /LENGTH=219 /DNA_ID=CAMNT_0017638755 /DNA_START=145 /DNA_END=802 /DNA_ORIENTATION=-